MIEACDFEVVMKTYSVCRESSGSMAYLNCVVLCVNSSVLPVRRALFYASMQ